MDAATEERPARRGRRALPLIVLALVVLAAASLAYLRPTFNATPKLAPPSASPHVLSNTDFVVAYDFVTPSVGWALEVSRGTGPALPGSLQFLDASHAWFGAMAGTRPLVETTDDGGLHWTMKLLPAIKT